MTTTKTFNYSHTVGFLAATGRGFTNPVDLAINSQDVIYVINRAGPETPIRLPSKRVTMCNLNEDWFGDFGTGGKGDGQFWWPSAIIIDSDDQVYVADEALQRISVFNKDGEFLRKWGTKGSESGQLEYPSSMAFAADELRHDREFAVEAVKRSAWALGHLPESMHKDKDPIYH